MTTYDAIVVGARCAGAPAAMLLARKGYRVLLVDKMSFPSDIMSTHFIHLPGRARLQRWGLFERVIDSGCPAIKTVTLHLNGIAFTPPTPPLPPDITPETICPRRIVLDQILIDAAVEAGAELRQDFRVRDLLWDGDRVTGVRGGARRGEIEETARIVIGADGMHSTVARAVDAPCYDTKPSLTFGYYSYWSGLGVDATHIYFFDDARGVLMFPTHYGQTCIGVGGLHDGFHDFRAGIDANYRAVIDRIPELGERLRAGKREEPYVGTADMPNFFRKPYGAGWALVGDAGYHRDFITGLGITDAFRDAELVANAIDDGFSGRRPLEEAMADYESTRNRIAKPLYDFTTRMAAGEQVEPAEFMAFGAAMAAQIPA